MTIVNGRVATYRYDGVRNSMRSSRRETGYTSSSGFLMHGGGGDAETSKSAVWLGMGLLVGVAVIVMALLAFAGPGVVAL